MALFQFSRGRDSLRGTKKADRFVGDASTMTPSSVGATPDRIINFQTSDQIDLPGDWTRGGAPLKLRSAGTMKISRNGIELVDLKASAIRNGPNNLGAVGLFTIDAGGSNSKWSGSGLVWVANPQSALNPVVMLTDYRGPVAIV